jgi:riboflavin kinase/FMN adenylyltransferase
MTLARPAVCVGKFDALHLGHRALAEHAAGLGQPLLLTLSGMAAAFGWTPRAPLVAADDRARVLAGWSADLGAEVAEASLPIATVKDLDAAGFLRLLRERWNATALVVGRDFRCGRKRSAGTTELAALAPAAGLALAVVEPVTADGRPVSSSRIRSALEAGDLADAATCLGRPHRIVGTVGRGDGRGRQLGFPTVNLGAGDNDLPATGVYAARALLDGTAIPAAVNIGRLPTLGPDRPVGVEAHLIGWSGDCYGRRIGLDLIARLREERRFANFDELRAQIAADSSFVRPFVRSSVRP